MSSLEFDVQNVQIFLSYARDDDVSPPLSPRLKGFVSALCEQLRYEFTNKGPSRPNVWRDQREIGRAEQFDQKIEDATKASALLVVVFSENWLSRPYCLRELETFAKHWRDKGETDDLIRKRITVVGKRPVAGEQRPLLLQGVESFQFYAMERVGGEEHYSEFFKNGERRDPRYVDRIEELAAHLWREAVRYDRSESKRSDQSKEEPSHKAFGKNRTIYLAKPTSDMVEAYDRLTRELVGRGYRVVPGADAEIPDDPTALKFVDDALGGAEISIHLLGEKLGWCPEDLPPIAKLQLERAEARVTTDGAGRFHRLIWAPMQLTQSADPTENATTRDPLQVLARFHRQLPTDRVYGKALKPFVDFVGQHLTRIETRPQIPVDASVYIHHSGADEEYAIALKNALEERNVYAELPAFGGSDVEIRNFHMKMLMECDAVIVCWAHASEVWFRSQLEELKNWRALGRKDPFVFRGVVIGPPADRRKRNVKQLLPRGAFDLVVDLEDRDLPLPELLDDLIPQAEFTQGAVDNESTVVSGATELLDASVPVVGTKLNTEQWARHARDLDLVAERRRLIDGVPPDWASEWGEDRFGLFLGFTIGEATQRMRWIPPGKFLMGSPASASGRFVDEGPQHEVTITQGFWLFETPCTQALWRAVMEENPSRFQSPDRPVESVSWNDAQKFIAMLNERIAGLSLSLPSEAQWEYACRAGTQGMSYSGDFEILGERNAPSLDAIAWYGGNSGKDFDLDEGWDSASWPEKQYEDSKAGTRRVKLKRPNAYGLYDMLGNVWEWVEDAWHENYDGAPADGSAWRSDDSAAGRVLRGESWDSSAQYVRSASRYGRVPDARNGGIGFRCARVQA